MFSSRIFTTHVFHFFHNNASVFMANFKGSRFRYSYIPKGTFLPRKEDFSTSTSMIYTPSVTLDCYTARRLRLLRESRQSYDMKDRRKMNKLVKCILSHSVHVQSGYIGGARAHGVPASIAQGNHWDVLKLTVSIQY